LQLRRIRKIKFLFWVTNTKKALDKTKNNTQRKNTKLNTETVWARVRVITSAAEALLHLVELVLVDMEGEEHVGVTRVLLHFC